MKVDSRFPFFLLLLPLFFILHGLTENYVPALVPVGAELFIVYSIASLLLAGIAWLFLRDITKAAIVATFLMSFEFFFGSLHDFLEKHAKNTFITKYTVLVPLMLIVLLLIFLWLRKRQRPNKLSQFLNLLFVVFIIIDLAGLLPRAFGKKPAQVADLSSMMPACDTCGKPDVYLIIADEYAGQQELQEQFGFNNSEFFNELSSRGFHVVNNSTSNFNATVYSMASIFGMDYLNHLGSTTVNHRDMLICRGIIKRSNVVNFFTKGGYQFYNQSYFEFDDKKKLVYNPFYPTEQALFTAQTFTSRFRRNLGFHFASQKELDDIINHHLYNNKTIDSTTRVIASTKAGPKFVYTHLAMPHHPYYYDSTGNKNTAEKLDDGYKSEKAAYLSYLKYANQQLLSLIDFIIAHSKIKPVIILMSDHGYRQFRAAEHADHRYYFMNLNAVLLPSANYNGFYDGMSNVNEFRALLNGQFGQHLPMLKDSATFLEEPQVDF
jgi:hypothetical protein